METGLDERTNDRMIDRTNDRTGAWEAETSRRERNLAIMTWTMYGTEDEETRTIADQAHMIELDDSDSHWTPELELESGHIGLWNWPRRRPLAWIWCLADTGDEHDLTGYGTLTRNRRVVSQARGWRRAVSMDVGRDGAH